jgi:hypothetical protein
MISLYAGGDWVQSATETPRAYYLIALAIEDIWVIAFSRIGYSKGITVNRVGGVLNNLSDG